MCEPVKPGGAHVFGDMPLVRVTTKNLRVLRDRKSGLPGAQMNRVKAIKRMFSWAISNLDSVTTNPARDLERPRMNSAGWPTWSLEDVKKFEAFHPIGSKARLALTILMYTGMRRSDLVGFGPRHIVDGCIVKTQVKNRANQAVRTTIIEIPVLPALQEVMNATKLGSRSFLETSFGKPFAVAGFGNWFHDRCNEAGLVGRSAHGMRKAAATLMAENGASTYQLMSIFGWSKPEQADIYTKQVARKKLAAESVGLLMRRAQ